MAKRKNEVLDGITKKLELLKGFISDTPEAMTDYQKGYFAALEGILLDHPEKLHADE